MYSQNYAAAFSLSRLWTSIFVKTIKKTVFHTTRYSRPMPQKPALQTASSSLVCYVGIDGKQVGPLNEAELAKLVANKQINKDTYAWLPGMPAWKAISEIPEILRIIALAPPPLP